MFALVLSALLLPCSAMLLYQFWTRALVIEGTSTTEGPMDSDELSGAPVLRIDTAA